MKDRIEVIGSLPEDCFELPLPVYESTIPVLKHLISISTRRLWFQVRQSESADLWETFHSLKQHAVNLMNILDQQESDKINTSEAAWLKTQRIVNRKLRKAPAINTLTTIARELTERSTKAAIFDIIRMDFAANLSSLPILDDLATAITEDAVRATVWAMTQGQSKLNPYLLRMPFYEAGALAIGYRPVQEDPIQKELCIHFPVVIPIPGTQSYGSKLHIGCATFQRSQRKIGEIDYTCIFHDLLDICPAPPVIRTKEDILVTEALRKMMKSDDFHRRLNRMFGAPENYHPKA